MLYVCLLLFLISIGSIRLQIEKNPDAIIMFSVSGKLLLIFFTIIELIMIVITVCSITALHWFWSLIISILGALFLSNFLATFYSSILGVKSKPTLSLMTGTYVRYNIHAIDAIITFIVGFILYLIA